MRPPHIPTGGYFCPLPNRSGMYQGTTPTTWLNFNTPCKSQLKNAWPFSPTTLTYEQHVSVFLFFFVVFIVSDLNDLIYMYTKIFVLFSYDVTINAYIGNTCNEIFKYY